jgi:hypothetical protein
MPEDEDIQGNMSTTAKHAAFVAVCQFTFRLSWSGAIRMNRRTNPRAPLPLSVRILATRLLQTGMINLPTKLQIVIRTQPESPQPAPLPTLTQQQLQWLEEDLQAEMPLSTLPPYHSCATTEMVDDESIPALALVLEDEDHEEAQTLAPGSPMLGVHPGFSWFYNRTLAREDADEIATIAGTNGHYIAPPNPLIITNGDSTGNHYTDPIPRFSSSHDLMKWLYNEGFRLDMDPY